MQQKQKGAEWRVKSMPDNAQLVSDVVKDNIGVIMNAHLSLLNR